MNSISLSTFSLESSQRTTQTKTMNQPDHLTNQALIRIKARARKTIPSLKSENRQCSPNRDTKKLIRFFFIILSSVYKSFYIDSYPNSCVYVKQMITICLSKTFERLHENFKSHNFFHSNVNYLVVLVKGIKHDLNRQFCFHLSSDLISKQQSVRVNETGLS